MGGVMCGRKNRPGVVARTSGFPTPHPIRQHNMNVMPSLTATEMPPPTNSTSALRYELLAKCSVRTVPAYTTYHLRHKIHVTLPPSMIALTADMIHPDNTLNTVAYTNFVANNLTSPNRQPKPEQQLYTSHMAPSSCRSSCLWLRRRVSRV